MNSGDKLDFNEAMRDFRTMFPTLDDALIESVLRSNHGAVDDTIDQLLAISVEVACGENPNSSKHVTNANVSADEMLLDFLNGSPSNQSSSKKVAKKIYRPPLVGRLPKDFLRLDCDLPVPKASEPPERRNDANGLANSVDYATIVQRSPTRSHQTTLKHKPQQNYGAHLGIFSTTGRIAKPSTSTFNASRQKAAMDTALKRQGEIFKEKMIENDWKRQLNQDPELERYLEDERVALMLQNEEFILHLKNDPDFLAALERDERNNRSSRKKKSISSSKSPVRNSERIEVASTNDEKLIDEADPFPYTKILPKQDTIETPFGDKLKFMGKTSKRKFAILARKFVRKKKGAKGIIGNSESNYSDVCLLSGHNLADESELLLEEEDVDGASAPKPGGYNQPGDDSYNINHKSDLKEGRLFSTYR